MRFTLRILLSIYLLTPNLCVAQTFTRSIEEGLTPPSIAPGRSAGSKQLSQYESINLYKGHVNLSVPLLQIGGRGKAGYTMYANTGSAPWSTNSDIVPFCATTTTCTGFQVIAGASNMDIEPVTQHYGPGIVYVKHSGYSVVVCPDGMGHYGLTYSHIVFEDSTGAQHALSDQTTSMVAAGCSGSVPARPGPFRSVDGSQMTFVPTDPIVDRYTTLEQERAFVSGTLKLPDGSTYIIYAGRVSRIYDTHGNYIDFYYGTAASFDVTQIIDSLGRVTRIEYDKPEQISGSTVYYDKIHYGSQASLTTNSKFIKVRRQRYDSLGFTGFTNLDNGLIDFSQLVREIFFPNGTQFTFSYNTFGELSRVVLPEGGAIEYTHGAGLSNATAGNSGGLYADGQILDNTKFELPAAEDSSAASVFRTAIYRRLTERRTYPNGGTGAVSESKTTYSLRESATATLTNNGKAYGPIDFTLAAYLEESTTGASIPSAIAVRHYFHENNITTKTVTINALSPARSMLAGGNGPPRMVYDNYQYESKEWRTETPGFRRSDRAFVLGADRGLRTCHEVGTLLDQAPNPVSTTLSTFDIYGNPADQYNYAYGSGPVFALTATVNTDTVPVSCGTPSGSYLQYQHRSYETSANYTSDLVHIKNLLISDEVQATGGVTVSKSTYSYDKDASGAAAALEALEATSPVNYDSVNFDESVRPYRGNLTVDIKYVASGSTLTNEYRYDVLGNRRALKNPNAVANRTTWTLFSFADNCSAGPLGTLLAFPTKVTLPQVTVSGSATNFAATTKYDCWLGKPTKFTDINLVSSDFDYTDTANMDRLISVKRAVGTNVETRVRYQYTDTALQVAVKTYGDLNSLGDEALQSTTLFDGFGRPVKESKKTGANATVKVETVYDGLHRTRKVSNPVEYTSTEPASTEWTTSSYDLLGRVLSVTKPDNTIENTSYAGNATVVTDEANKTRRYTADSLGRLVKVEENQTQSDSYLTQYAYQGTNLVTVCPDGGTLTGFTCSGVGQARTFSYDWLARLLTAVNPESGNTTYTYDSLAGSNGKGRLTSKSDARLASVNFNYDLLGRLTSKSYTAAGTAVATEAVSYSYDAHESTPPAGVTSYSKGRITLIRTGSTDPRKTVFQAYDALGEVTYHSQTIGTSNYAFGVDLSNPGYTYTRSGSLKTIRYPTGRTFLTTFDSAGRPNALQGDYQGATTQYIESLAYTAHSAPALVRYAGGATGEDYTYNSRLQQTGMSVKKCTSLIDVNCSGTLQLSLGFSYIDQGASLNNGNLTSQTIQTYDNSGTPQATALQSFTYDAFNRLKTFTEGAIIETHCYDAHGNRAVQVVSGLSPQVPQVSTANCNAAGVGSVYPGNKWAGVATDAAGNIVTDNGSTMTWDVEGRMVNAPQSGTSYDYDGEGRRVRKRTGGVATRFVYDAFGKLAMDDGGLSETSNLQYLHKDHLGSTRLLTSNSGEVTRRYDYRPFGAVLTGIDTSWRSTALNYDGVGVVLKFTGKERDDETGLDYFGARYMSSAQGRFTSPDAPMLAQHPSEPQSWNLYSYTANNPLSRIDPDGRNWFQVGGAWQWHEGSDINNDGDPCKKGSRGCNHSDYTHLLVYQKTGTNKEGAATGTLTLYGNDQGKALMSSPVFSGGGGTPAAGEGSYRINLGRLETLKSSDILTGIGQNGLRYGYLGPHYGVQELPADLMGSASPWGSIRARLNEWIAGGVGLPENMKGLFLHGSSDGHDYTNGCLCERSERVLRWIRDTAKNKTPGVFPTIPLLVRK